MKKKLFYMLAALVPALAITSCDDSNDLPNVDFNVQIENGVVADNQIYVAQGDTLYVESVSVVNNEQGKAVTIPYVNYYLNNVFIGQSIIQPYGIKIPISEKFPVGQYPLDLVAPVYAVDKTPAEALLSYTVNVVENKESIPENGGNIFTGTAQMSEIK